MRCWLAACVLVAAAVGAPAAAAATPALVSVEFTGNAVTQRRTLMRQVTVELGEPISQEDVEATRQSIQNLGLFKSVTAELRDAPGGKALHVAVDEKFYLLPLPRVDFNSDREFSFGFKIDWSNFRGLNHNLALVWEDSENAEADRGNDRVLELEYRAPFFMDSHHDLSLFAGQRRTPVTDTEDGAVVAAYEERSLDYQVLVFRQLGERRFGRGWRIGGGLQWTSQEFVGGMAPPSIGEALFLVAQADNRRIDDRLFSLQGHRYGLRLQSSTEHLAADYQQLSVVIDGAWFRPVGRIRHQTFSLLGAAGSFHGGSLNRRNPAFGLGGGNNLRGFDKNVFEGDAFWTLSAEYQRPVFGTPALRGLLVLDTGAAYRDWEHVTLSDVQVNVGVGVRWRIQAFVDLTVELGMAWPLTAGGSELFFGKVR